MNKYLEKIAAKLSSAVKENIRESVKNGVLPLLKSDAKKREMKARALGYGHKKIPRRYMGRNELKSNIKEYKARQDPSVEDTWRETPRASAILNRLAGRKK